MTLRRRDRNDPRIWRLSQNSPRQVLARHIRQQQIERDYIRPVPPDGAHGLFTTRSRGDHSHVFLAIDQRRETFLHHFMAIHGKDRDAPGNDPQLRMLYDCRYRTRHNVFLSQNYGEQAPRYITRRKVFAVTPPSIAVLTQPRYSEWRFSLGFCDTTDGVSVCLVGQLMKTPRYRDFIAESARTLLEMLELMSSRILLIDHRPAGELIGMP
jgi:hypothetical protein